jgi:hypothetical protein
LFRKPFNINIIVITSSYFNKEDSRTFIINLLI